MEPREIKDEIFKEWTAFWKDGQFYGSPSWFDVALTRYAKACVPEYKQAVFRSNWPDVVNEILTQRDIGWNDCLEEMKKRII